MNRVRFMTFIAAVTVAATAMPFTAQAASNQELRTKVISYSGIITNTHTEEYVTRGAFAKMLVNATSYKSVASNTSTTAVFADVPADNQYASAIRIAAENGWMNGYLGGVFRPDNQITLQEAVRGVLALLGYTNDDFTGDQIGGRWNKYLYLDLGENISKEPQEILTRTDCINLFYNLLRTENKSGKAYCTTLGYELTSDGEVNAMSIADNSLKGPKLVKERYSISDYVPFDVNEATFYLDGEFSTLERVKQEKNNGFIVIYYNTASKTIWAYSSAYAGEETNTSKVAIKGEVTGIYYNSSDVMTPSTVVLDDDTSVQYKLGNTDVQFAFSIYGEFEVGDDVVLICEATTNSYGDITYTVIDYVEY